MKNNNFVIELWNAINYSWKKSFSIATYIIAAISTFMTIVGVSLHNICSLSIIILLIITLFLYLLLTLIIRYLLSKKQVYSIKARKNNVIIKSGDIFNEKGLILIPFNEYYDTKVDDIIISSNSLNGKLLKNFDIDIDDLNEAIMNSKDPKNLPRKKTNRGFKFPLGRIIKYKNYLLLSFSHFDDDNVAQITRIEYEQCLITMWKELRRTYNGETIVLPLIGSGITSFTDLTEKSNIDLLKCMICTLKFSKEQFQSDIKIVVKSEVWDDLNLVNNIIEL